jgi:hypothetical protein
MLTINIEHEYHNFYVIIYNLFILDRRQFNEIIS